MANFISKKHLSRRTLLRGAGSMLALPLLESMIPAGTLKAQESTVKNPFRGNIFSSWRHHVKVDTA